jgi:hypothetical protein
MVLRLALLNMVHSQCCRRYCFVSYPAASTPSLLCMQEFQTSCLPYELQSRKVRTCDLARFSPALDPTALACPISREKVLTPVCIPWIFASQARYARRTRTFHSFAATKTHPTNTSSSVTIMVWRLHYEHQSPASYTPSSFRLRISII